MCLLLDFPQEMAYISHHEATLAIQTAPQKERVQSYEIVIDANQPNVNELLSFVDDFFQKFRSQYDECLQVKDQKADTIHITYEVVI